MEELFGDATQELLRMEGASENSKHHRIYNLFGMTKKHGLLQRSTQYSHPK